MEEREKSLGVIYRMIVPVADLGGRIDIGNIRHLGFYAYGLPEKEDWFLTGVIDDVKLVAKRGRKPEWTEPFVLFEGLEADDTVSPGGVLSLSASFGIARKFRQNYGLFVHIIQEKEPHFAIHLERNPFRSTSTWEVGKIYREGVIYIPIPHDAPLGRYFINVGIFKGREELGGATIRYVNTYLWSDGIYTEEQPSRPVDYIKEPYINRTSKEQWTVGHVNIVSKAAKEPPEKIGDEQKQMMGIVTSTEKDILGKPPPGKYESKRPPVKRLTPPESQKPPIRQPKEGPRGD
jgi:hypothetical protein